MNIRRAKEQDMGGINNLLCQVLMIHHKGRPDLFKEDTKNIQMMNFASLFMMTQNRFLYV